MKVTKELLKKMGACPKAIECYIEHKEPRTLKKVFKLLMSNENDYLWRTENRLSWANWFVCKLFNKEQCVKYAIFSAEKVLNLFEQRHPNDQRPRKAIEASKKYLKVMFDDINSDNYIQSCRELALAANVAAYTAETATIDNLDADAVNAAVYTAYTAYSDDAKTYFSAAYAAANKAAVAYSNVNSYGNHYMHTEIKNEITIEILNYGLILLEIKL